MTREEYAEALLQNVQGFDNDPRDNPNMNQFDSDVSDEDAFGADDPVKSAGLSTLPIQLTIANAASLSLDLFRVDDLSAAALPTGIASPVIAAYRNIIAYLLASASMLQSIIIQSNESATGGAPVLSSLRIAPKRVTPFGLSASNEVRVQSYQTTQDFQANRATIPLKVALDSFSFLNLVTDVNGSGATVTLNLTFLIGRRTDNRKQLKGGTPLAMRPGGRGVVAVNRK